MQLATHRSSALTIKQWRGWSMYLYR